jgi:ribosome-associated toxin RatA of RatAB toxin-antitoxin module
VSRAAHTEVIAAPAEACFDAITDFDSYPSWQKAVKAVEVLERDADGRGTLVEFRVDAKIREVRYVLRYHFDRPRRITWDYVEGDAKDVDGEYRFDSAGDGATACTYEIEVDVGMFVPGKMKQALSEKAVRSSLDALKERLEGTTA